MLLFCSSCQRMTNHLISIITHDRLQPIHPRNTGSSSLKSWQNTMTCNTIRYKTRMWANAQRDGALPNIGGALRSMPQCLAAATTRVPCSNAAKTWNLCKFVEVPQTNEPISAASGPKFTIFKDRWGRYCCLTSFFPIVDMRLSCKDIDRQSCAIECRWRIIFDFLHPIFSASHVQHVSDLHPKLALRAHHVWKYGRHLLDHGWE